MLARSLASRASRSIDSQVYFWSQKAWYLQVLATFGEKRVLRLSSLLGWAPGGLPGAILEAFGALRDRFWEVFWMNFGWFLHVCRMVFCSSFFDDFQVVFSKSFSWFFLFVRSARKRPTRLKHCKNQWIFMIFLGARLRLRSGEGEGKRQKTT